MYLFLIPVCLLVGMFVYAIKVRNSRLYHVVKQYPACFTELPLVGPFYRFAGNSEELLSTLIESANSTTKLGGISRLYGLNICTLVLTESSDVAEVLKYYLNKDDVYMFLQSLTGKGSIFNTDSKASKVRRQMFLPSFSSERLSAYTESVWKQSIGLAESLAPYVGTGPFPIGDILGGFCFDNVIGAADIKELGEEFNSVKACLNYTQCLQLVIERWASLWMQTDLLYKLSNNRRKINRLAASFYAYADRAQEIRRNKLTRFLQRSKDNSVGDDEENIKPGFFDSLINSKLSRREICEEIQIMFAASDEVGVAIYFTLKILGLYPTVQDNVYKELKDICGDTDRPFLKEDLMRTRYLDMVVKEVLRLFPPVPFIFRKAHTETILTSGRVIPAGAGIAIPIYSLHRNPEYWGDDAENFDPERFQPERLAAVPSNAYMPFSYGPRGCPGYKFSHMIVKTALCAILRRYKVVDTPAAGPAPRIRTKFEVTMRAVDEYIELVNRR